MVCESFFDRNFNQKAMILIINGIKQIMKPIPRWSILNILRNISSKFFSTPVGFDILLSQ